MKVITEERPKGAAAPQLDVVTLALLNNRFDGVVRAMMNTLFRTGRSVVLNTSRDFSACVITHRDELLSTAESLPIHVMAGPDIMSRVMREFHPDLRRGDAFLHNSPYHGNSHAADHSIMVPVVDDEGVHHFTVLVKAHQADCGNALPTTYAAWARDVYEEGALIFPCVKVEDQYRALADITRMCRLRIRVPDQWWGDYLAQLGAARIGEKAILELAREYGWDTLHAYTNAWFDYSEQRMISAIKEMPYGEITTESAHDPFPGVPDGIPVRASVKVDPDQARIDIDLHDNVDCQPCGLNLSEATSRTAAMIGVFNGIDHSVPKNAGSFRRLRVHLRENCAVGIPRHPASCSVATTGLADRLVNAIQRGLAELQEGLGLAEQGVAIPAQCAVISGFDPRADNRPFINQLVLPSLTGGAGAPKADGYLTTGLPAAAGHMLRDSVEIVEHRFPIRIEMQTIVPDSEGAGRFRGSPGGLAEYGPVGTSIELMYTSDGNVNPVLGARGGLPGGRAKQLKRHSNGSLSDLGSAERAVLEPGETIVTYSCGGGGYGPPGERDPRAVRIDVIEDYVTRERARDVYGVALTADDEIDWEQTKQLRELTTAVS